VTDRRGEGPLGDAGLQRATSSLQLGFGAKIAHNIGLVVLASQELETHLKLVVALSSGVPDGDVISLHGKLQRRSLGEVVKRLLANAEVVQGSPEDLQRYFEQLLDRRNRIVHHFFQTYRTELAAGNESAVLGDLAALHGELREVTRAFESINRTYVDALASETAAD
jgi:hypothetical protein